MAKAYLESHPEVMEELDRKVRAHYHLSGEGENAEEGGESGKADGKAGTKESAARSASKSSTAQESAGKNSASSDFSLKGGKKE